MICQGAIREVPGTYGSNFHYGETAIKSKLLGWISHDWSKNKDKYSNKDYPQTWHYIPIKGKIRGFIQWLCNRLGGHELSETEWGYGGGDSADRWCRWCNKKIKVSKNSILFEFEGAREIMSMVGRTEE